MDYTVKGEINAVTGLLFTCMSQGTRTDDRIGATESKFYLPAGVTPSSTTSRFERLWATLFNHGIDTST